MTLKYQKVIILSKNLKLAGLIEQTAKLQNMKYWLDRSKNCYDLYILKKNSKPLKPFDDPHMVECEAMFYTAICFYLRCFQSQQGYFLDINKVTKDVVLRDTHWKILEIRDDEYVHWKISKSRIKLLFNIEIDGSKVIVDGPPQASLNSSIGFQDSSNFYKLIQCGLDHIHIETSKRGKEAKVLFSDQSVIDETEFLSNDGKVLK